MLLSYLLLFYALSMIAISSKDHNPLIKKRNFGSNFANLSNYIIPLNRVPFLVLIAYSNKYCSGVLVKSRIVITAASCFQHEYQKVIVKVGATTMPSFGQIIDVLEVKTHEYFRHHGALDNDIAMLVLKDHVMFGEKVKKAVLMDADMSIRPDTIISVVGWGSTNLNQMYVHKILLSEMTVLEKDVCVNIFGPLMSSSNYCAHYQINLCKMINLTTRFTANENENRMYYYNTPLWDPYGKDRGLSDNGGPAVYNDQIVGILSYGVWEYQEPYAAIFTNVSYFHRWITTNSELFLKKYCQLNVKYRSKFTNIKIDKNTSSGGSVL